MRLSWVRILAELIVCYQFVIDCVCVCVCCVFVCVNVYVCMCVCLCVRLCTIDIHMYVN